jgi:DNA repair exonuclease SbcCD ATPase subunit
MIRFTKLRWKNFLSTGNVFTEIDLCGKDTTLIIGTNGAGKSTILDALTFGLFGKPFRKINKPQLVNSITQKNCLVEVEFGIGTHQYKIIRGMKPSVFEVYQDDKLLNQSADVKDYQELLEKQILKVNQKSFSQVVILGSATFQPFMQLPGGQRREIIEDLLELNIFTTMNCLLKDKIQDNFTKITECLNQKKLLESKIEMTQEHMQELQKNNEKIIEEKRNIITDTKKQITKLEKKHYDITEQIQFLKENIDDETSISKKINKLSQLRHQINAKVKILNENIEFFSSHDSCPTCGQDIEEQFKHNCINENETKLSEIDAGLTKLSAEYDAANQRLNEIMKVIDGIRSKEMEVIELKTNIKSLTIYLVKINDEISNLQNTKQEVTDNRITEFKNSLQIVEKDYNTLVEDKDVLNAAGILLKDTGIKSKIIKQYIPIINKLINKYLAAMDFFVSFELDENFNEKIRSRHRDDFTYASFSEGEKQKIDLALLFTWRAVAKLRNSINTNLLIMDEVFDSSLDLNATEYLLNIINDVAKDNNIFIISHKEHMNEKFTNVLKFVKNKNFSQIQE